MKKPQNPPKFSLSELEGKLIRLLEKEQVGEFINEQNEKYKHWDEIRHYSDTISGLRPEEVWKLIKVTRMNRFKRIPLWRRRAEVHRYKQDT